MWRVLSAVCLLYTLVAVRGDVLPTGGVVVPLTRLPSARYAARVAVGGGTHMVDMVLATEQGCSVVFDCGAPEFGSVEMTFVGACPDTAVSASVKEQCVVGTDQWPVSHFPFDLDRPQCTELYGAVWDNEYRLVRPESAPSQYSAWRMGSLALMTGNSTDVRVDNVTLAVPHFQPPACLWEVGGMLGLSTLGDTLVHRLRPDPLRAVRLDLRASAAENSTMTLLTGGDDFELCDDLRFCSMKQPSVMERFYEYFIYDLSICGTSVFWEFSSSWIMHINTLAPCMYLPGEFFDSVMSWIGATCDAQSVCTVDPTRKLPSMSFRLNEDGAPLLVPLGTLMEPNGTLCMVRWPDIEDHVEMYRVMFGTRVLESLVVDMSVTDLRVSMHNKGDAEYVDLEAQNAERCPARAQCVGSQVYNMRHNVCDPPPCADYYFQIVDESTQRCKMSVGFQVMLFLFLALCALSELLQDRAYHRIKELINRTHPPQTW